MTDKITDLEDQCNELKAEVERLRAMVEWQPIDTYSSDVHQVLCSHAINRWIRFGRQLGSRWYYSGTNERSQYAQVEGDAPTHWRHIEPPKDTDK